MRDQNFKGEVQLISKSIRQMLSEGEAGVLTTLIALPSESGGLRVGARMLVKESGERVGSLGSADLDEVAVGQVKPFSLSCADAGSIRLDEVAASQTKLPGVQLLFERIEAEPRLVIAGAGHVGSALARLAALVGYRVTLIDDRGEFLSRDLFSTDSEQGIVLVIASDWSDALSEAIGNGRSVSVAIVTRGHKQDEECLRAAIAASPFYIGMIGSKRRTNIVIEKLREEGAAEAGLKRVRAPIGLDIGAVSPEEVALAILAEVVAERRGGKRVPLSAWRRQ